MKTALLGIQHLLTMFGATVLVPILTGVPVSVALFTSGLGTLIFHLITKRKVPIYLGSSFAFISPFIAVTSYYAGNEHALAYATGGIVMAGIVYLLFSLLVKKIGPEGIKKIFPNYITGTIIILIGLMLASTAVSMASGNWVVAFITILVILLVRLYGKKLVQQLPIIIGVAVGYLVALAMGDVTFEFTGWINMPEFFLPRFSWYAFSIMVPAAIAPALEHIGDIFAVSGVVGKDYTVDPGLHKTLLSDGLATSVAGLLGGPANTTYSENTGVLALTKVFNPLVMEITAVLAIILSFFSPLSDLIRSIPSSVMGGACLILFGMIATTGFQLILKDGRYQSEMSAKEVLVMALMLIIGIGGAKIGWGNFVMQGTGLAAIVGIVLNALLIHKKTSV